MHVPSDDLQEFDACGLVVSYYVSLSKVLTDG